ncbi:gamma-type small acid-soluble spore protein [Niallia oryzisoli]|uniref:Small, acid-soluble spore protein gamma-type n=1 Tax=Niallia oryzisoli TaxID=1737571 RepID=A0ABZ2CMM6_9BACI
MDNNQGRYTVSGTNIDEVKRLNAQSGMSYNEVKAYLAQTTGGHGTRNFSNTEIEEVKRKNQQSMDVSKNSTF